MSQTLLSGQPRVIGTIHSAGSLARALRLSAGALDLLEVRVDYFAAQPQTLLRALPKLKCPLLITVRHPAEGGVNALSVRQRRELFREFLPFAGVIDIELRSVNSFPALIAAARARATPLIISQHNFRATPAPAKLAAYRESARAAGADIFKIATLTSTAADLAALLSLFQPKSKLPLSVMGMGPLGKVSRLALARAGSVFNYGYLDQPNASGQWEATLLKKRIAEL